MAWGVKEDQITITVNHLAGNKVKSLFMIPAFVKIDSSNVHRLAEALSTNESLLELNLSGHNFGVDGAALIGSAIGNHKNITTVSIGHDTIGTDLKQFQALFKEILERSNSITSLSLSKKSLNLESMKIITPLLIGNSTLTQLDLSDNDIDIESLELLGTFLSNPKCNVSTLVLSNNKFHDKSQDLSLSDIFIDSLIQCKSLKKLQLSENYLGDMGAVRLARFMKLNENTEELDINDCGISSKGAMAIGDALVSWSGSQLSISSNPMVGHYLVSNWTQSPTKQSNVQKLHLRGCLIGDDGIISLCNNICNGLLPKLQVLDLAHNRITVKSLNMLSNILIQSNNENSYKPTIETLDISFNVLGSEGKDTICQWISTGSIQTLKQFNLNSVKMGFYDIADICKYLLNNQSSIKHMDIQENTDKPQTDQTHNHSNYNNNNHCNDDDDDDNDDDEEDPRDTEFYENHQELQDEKEIIFKWR
ncbi:leucine-rich repeat-containing protein (LRR) [Tieghemostelium lacteum]|uniref:Leucine-rich repeat-containing protein (LRR) n=1 Tax=Tieghemostelium lacteum TaxID=361077 RepID=A0A151Z2W7_TIELA|nr:leucine-rich repeat-containing protein (LRR) [Tieghemostelium lacteum]|eukprot:KYQ88300.1 leucine-rich repeat-containing protein (LRR) [Tieghemostelium lacteum]